MPTGNLLKLLSVIYLVLLFVLFTPYICEDTVKIINLQTFLSQIALFPFYNDRFFLLSSILAFSFSRSIVVLNALSQLSFHYSILSLALALHNIKALAS